MAEKTKTIETMQSLMSTIYEFKNPWLYKYYCLGVTQCNADNFATFSENVSLGLEMIKNTKFVKPYVDPSSLCEIFRDMVTQLIIAKEDYESSEILYKTTRCLEKFIENVEIGGHLKCLRDMQKRRDLKDNSGVQKLSKAEIQTVLSCHLFSPLLTEGEVIADRMCYENKVKPECPFCKSKIQTGVTNFGCKKYWHGQADIVIKGKCVRTVVTCTTEEEEEEEGQGEPTQKKVKLDNDEEDVWNTVVEVKPALRRLKISKDIRNKIVVSQGKSFTQSITQTLVNAFLAVKENKQLENYFIPSFLVSDEHVIINFYNVKGDVLLSQADPFPLFEQLTNDLNYSTIFAVWFALNFDRFLSSCTSKAADYFNKNFQKSGFSDYLIEKKVLKDYEDNVMSEFLSADKPEDTELNPGAHNDHFIKKLFRLVNELKAETAEK